MAKKLVIVESPHKSKTIEKYLGKDYKVVSSLGHIRDLKTTGKFGLGVDVENNFEPSYGIIKGKNKLESYESAAGDIVGDGQIKINDVGMLYRYVKGRIPTLEVE